MAELSTMRAIEAELMRPGAPFELVDVEILGRAHREWRHRASSLREIIAAGAGRRDADHLVHAERRWTYVETIDAVAGVASGLRRLGVEPGHRVGVLAANCPEWVISFWAAVSIGAVAVGLNGWWTAD